MIHLVLKGYIYNDALVLVGYWFTGYPELLELKPDLSNPTAAYVNQE